MSFKVGDKVRRCTSLNDFFKDKTKVWEVLVASEGNLQFAGHNSWWDEDKFILVEGPPSLPGIPEGYRAVRFGHANNGEWYMSNFTKEPVVTNHTTSGTYLVVEHCEATEEVAPAVPMSDEVADAIVQAAIQSGLEKCDEWPKWYRWPFDTDNTCTFERLENGDLIRHNRGEKSVLTVGKWCGGNGLISITKDEAMARIAVPKPQPPAELPDDWVEITDPEHVLRADDELNGCLDSVKELGIDKSYGWLSAERLGNVGRQIKPFTPGIFQFRFRCRRRDLPVAKPATEQITVPPSHHENQRQRHGAAVGEQRPRIPPADGEDLCCGSAGEKMSDATQNRVWQSYVWHEDKCFFVSTIRRKYDTAVGEINGHETMVWRYDWKLRKRGEMIGHMGGIVDHQRICRCLISEGEMLDEDNPKHERFFK